MEQSVLAEQLVSLPGDAGFRTKAETLDLVLAGNSIAPPLTAAGPPCIAL